MPWPRPHFLTVARLAPENLEAFLSLDLPGTKLVAGDGPEAEALKAAYPDAVFLGSLEHGSWPASTPARTSSCFPAAPTHSASC